MNFNYLCEMAVRCAAAGLDYDRDRIMNKLDSAALTRQMNGSALLDAYLRVIAETPLLKRTDEAIKLTDRCRCVLQDANLPDYRDLQARIRLYQSSNYLKKAQYQAAFELATKALPDLNKVSPHQKDLGYAVLAECLFAMHQDKAAEENLQTAISRALTRGNILEIAHTFNVAAAIYGKFGMDKETERCLKKNVEYGKQLPLCHEQAILELTRFYLRHNKGKQALQAMEPYEHSQPEPHSTIASYKSWQFLETYRGEACILENRVPDAYKHFQNAEYVCDQCPSLDRTWAIARQLTCLNVNPTRKDKDKIEILVQRAIDSLRQDTSCGAFQQLLFQQALYLIKTGREAEGKTKLAQCVSDCAKHADRETISVLKTSAQLYDEVKDKERAAWCYNLARSLQIPLD